LTRGSSRSPAAAEDRERCHVGQAADGAGQRRPRVAAATAGEVDHHAAEAEPECAQSRDRGRPGIE
jgi:hypothetical protein